jgi:hypothetical protein
VDGIQADNNTNTDANAMRWRKRLLSMVDLPFICYLLAR